jgi:gliding motility-associated peptidyl-prolyl isomerase
MNNISRILFQSFCIGLLLFSCKTPEARRPVSQQSGSFIRESVARNKKLVAYEEALIDSIIKQDTLNTYYASPNGFWYRYDTKIGKDTLTPQFGDLVNFDYDISTLIGQPIYTRKELGTREYAIDQESVFIGLRQALKMMKPGETLTFYFPSHKAFGYYGDNQKIGRNLPIRSTITLNSIELNNEKQLND